MSFVVFDCLEVKMVKEGSPFLSWFALCFKSLSNFNDPEVISSHFLVQANHI